MQVQLDLIALIGVSITVLTVVVGAALFIDQFIHKMRYDKLRDEYRTLEKENADISSKYEAIADDLSKVVAIGTDLLIRKGRIEDELGQIMKYVDAGAGSVFISASARNNGQPTGLAFLSILPMTESARTLRKRIIPLQSLAGRCFLTGIPTAIRNATQNPEHFNRADRISKFRTQDMLNVPLKYQGTTVGVLQLLNRQSGEPFHESDIPRVEPMAESLAVSVANFCDHPDALDLLGIIPDREAETATVMFCDLTQSSLLFKEMNTVAAIQHINEFLERICDVAFEHGATIDKYAGDGACFRFNVPRTLVDHDRQAVMAATEMLTAFNKLKSGWIEMGDYLENLYIRIGVSYGPVFQAVVGHPQYQYLTVFGQPVNVAANLCEAARRDSNVILMDDVLYRRVSKMVNAEPVLTMKIGKAAGYIAGAYEVTTGLSAR